MAFRSLPEAVPDNASRPGAGPCCIAAIAGDMPADVFDTAVLLTSEVVTNSVTHSCSDWVDVEITLATQRLRIDVSDGDPQSIRLRPGRLEGGWGITLLADLATSWGVERRNGGKTIWIELEFATDCDLTPEWHERPALPLEGR